MSANISVQIKFSIPIFTIQSIFHFSSYLPNLLKQLQKRLCLIQKCFAYLIFEKFLFYGKKNREHQK
ncbi:hypothetical protein SNEBB_011122 [Seison nebaliae]|nr:hypothetical protein SNEBB_011122 [Seison nebaliae]